ncbi:MAG: CapA family protein [Clostridiales bacterium]|nr:CapA family protein [Clostridiales bacterium]
MTAEKNIADKQKKRRQALALAAAFLCAALLFYTALGGALSGSLGQTLEGPLPDGAQGPAAARSMGKALRPKPVPPDWEFTIISTGDVMMHSPQTKAGYDPSDKSYDFAFMFEHVAPILREGDLVIGNLETPLAGEANGGYTGYPMFNAPEILARNLKDAGFTLVSTANNHSLDRRYTGLCATLDHLDEAGLLHTGTFRTPEERGRIAKTKVKGVSVAFIAATYGTNGLTLPAEHGYAVNYIDRDRLLDDISRARREGARYVIVMLHWGLEYQTKPNQEQTGLALELLKGGADLILGNHPHVLQKGEAVHPQELFGEGADAKDEKTRFVMYSQGNFISNQEGMDRNVSILLKLTIGVDGATGETYFKEAGYIPIYTQKRNPQGASRHTVWPLELALADLEGGGGAFGAGDRAILPKAWDYAVKSQPDLDLLKVAEHSGSPEASDWQD